MDNLESNIIAHDILNGITILDESITSSTILNIIKKLNCQNSKIYHHGLESDYSFTLNDGCTLNEVDKLESDIKYNLPNDYRQFMLATNGLTLCSITTSSRIFGIEEIYEVKETFNIYSKNMLAISSCCDGQIHIMIDLESSINKNIYIHEIMDGDYLYSIGCGFVEFLNRFILTYGSAFWEWGVKASDKIPLIR